MDRKQFAHGLFGGLIGFTLAAPLVLHEGWMRMVEFKEDNPTTTMAYFLGSILIFPVLMTLGILGSPLIGGYAAYQCGKSASLEPIFETFKRPYQSRSSEDQAEMNISRGMLIGYSTVLTVLSFTLLNVITQGAFGFLGVPGAFILSAMGAPLNSILETGLLTMALSYLGGVVGGVIGGLRSPAPQRPRTNPVFDLSRLNDSFTQNEMELRELDHRNDPSPSNSDAPFLRNSVILIEEAPVLSPSNSNEGFFTRWNKWFQKDVVTDEMRPINENDETEDDLDIVTFDTPPPTPQLLDLSQVQTPRLS